MVIAHNGKCADRLTSRCDGAKRVNRLLRVKFDDRPAKNKMTLNSVYSLVVKVSIGLLRDDVDAVFCAEQSDVLEAAVCQTRKYPKTRVQATKAHVSETISSTEEDIGGVKTETWTLLSNATFAKHHKQPQEFLEGTAKSREVIKTMCDEAFRILCKEKEARPTIVSEKLQLWGAGSPLNVWKADDGCPFVWDHLNQIGIVGDWLCSPSIQGAWESGHALGASLFKDTADSTVAVTTNLSRGLSGRFLPTSNNATSKRPMQEEGARVLVVGAGLVGALTAKLLRRERSDIHISVWEKARGAGGRASTTRFDGISANTGCQYLSSSDGTSAASILLDEVSTLGLAVRLEKESSVARSQCFRGVKVDWAATKGTSSIVKHFLSTSTNELRFGTRVKSLRQVNGRWSVSLSREKKSSSSPSSGNLNNEYDMVVLAMPPTEAARVLASNVDLRRRCQQATKRPSAYSRAGR